MIIFVINTLSPPPFCSSRQDFVVFDNTLSFEASNTTVRPPHCLHTENCHCPLHPASLTKQAAQLLDLDLSYGRHRRPVARPK